MDRGESPSRGICTTIGLLLTVAVLSVGCRGDSPRPTLSLHEAAKQGDVQQIKAHLERGANANAVRGGVTPLHWAVNKGHKKAAELLLSQGAEVNAADDDGYPPLYWALAGGRKDVATLLTSIRGRDADDGRAVQPAQTAAGYTETEAVKLLLAHGAAVNRRVRQGWMASSQGGLDDRQMGVVELLLERGADVNAKTWFGDTPLDWVAAEGFPKVAEMLLERGANLNARNKTGSTPLHSAARRGHTEVAELLLARGAAPNATDKLGATPLHHAAHFGHVGVAKLLLTHGADVNATDNRGYTPLMLATTGPISEVTQLLRRFSGSE